MKGGTELPQKISEAQGVLWAALLVNALFCRSPAITCNSGDHHPLLVTNCGCLSNADYLVPCSEHTHTHTHTHAHTGAPRVLWRADRVLILEWSCSWNQFPGGSAWPRFQWLFLGSSDQAGRCARAYIPAVDKLMSKGHCRRAFQNSSRGA